MSNQPAPPQRIYAKWVPEVGEWDLWDEHYGHDDEAHVYVPVEQRDELRAACEAALYAIDTGYYAFSGDRGNLRQTLQAALAKVRPADG